jgi:hypothetical protein
VRLIHRSVTGVGGRVQALRYARMYSATAGMPLSIATTIRHYERLLPGGGNSAAQCSGMTPEAFRTRRWGYASRRPSSASNLRA